MHHYPFHIGDYKKDTANLSLLEHGVYRMLIDCYYTQETPLPSDKAKLCRMIGARSADEVEAVSNIIDDYFTLTDHGYVQAGCDKVLQKIYAKSAKARVSVEKRWDKIKGNIREGYCKDTNVCENDTNVQKNDTIEILPNTHNPTPITNNKTLSSSGDDSHVPSRQNIDYQGIIDLYHKILPELPRVINMTDKRRSAIRTCANTKKAYAGLDFWEAFFNQVRKSDFLMGRTKDFQANIDMLTRHCNFVKVIEGGYK